MTEQQVVKVIQQPKAYEREELLKLKYAEKTLKSITKKKSDATKIQKSDSNDSEDCPKLVPIVDEDGFQLYNPDEDEEEEQELYENDSMEGEEKSYEDNSMDDVSLGSEYIEVNSDDADSLSSDINEKYLNRNDDDDSDSSVIDSVWIKQQKVDVIDATSCNYLDHKGDLSKEDSDVSLYDEVKQLPSQQLYKNVDVQTKGSILSTTIIDEPISKVNDDHYEVELQPDQEIENNDDINSEKLDLEESIENDSLDSTKLNETSQNSSRQTVNRIKTTVQDLANYNTKFFNAFDSNLVLVLLKDPFYIYGTVRLTLLAGYLDVYGHSLAINKEVEIFSPRGCSVIEIAPTSTNNKISKDTLKEILKSYETNFALADLKTIAESFNSEKDAIVLLQRNEGRKKVVQQFKKFMNENVFPNINNINMDRPLYNTEYLLRCLINISAQEQKCLQLPKQWQQLSVTPQSRIMLTGGKAVGKSTLLRYLINRHLPTLKKILLIDLDIGQPEIFVPQTVSCCVIKQPLLGPGFLLNLQPEKSYAVGHTNIALCAHKYLEAVRSLISYCTTHVQYKDMPWLINTMGYNKGFGLELISVIAKELPLTDVIQLQSSKEINNFDSILFPHVVSNVPRNMFIEESFNNDAATNKLDYRLHAWQSAVQQESRYQKEWDMSAKDLRYATLLARLSEALHGHAEWLTDCKPVR